MCTTKSVWILALYMFPYCGPDKMCPWQKRALATIPANFTSCLVTFYNKYVELYMTVVLTRKILIYLCSDIVLSIDYEYASMNFLPHDIGNHFCEYAGIHIFFLVFFNLFIQDKTYVKLYRLLAWVSTCPYNLGLMKIIIKLYYKIFFLQLLSSAESDILESDWHAQVVRIFTSKPPGQQNITY